MLNFHIVGYALSDYKYGANNFVFNNHANSTIPAAPEIDPNIAGLSFALALLCGIIPMISERPRS